MCHQIADHLDHAKRSVTVAQITASVVEADAVDLPGVNPIQADIADELLGAAVAIVEIGKEWPLTAHIWRIAWSLVKPEIGEAAIRLRPDVDVLEHTIEDDMNVAAVQLVNQQLEAGQPCCRGGSFVNRAGVKREE